MTAPLNIFANTLHGGLDPQKRTYYLALSGRSGATGRAHAAWYVRAIGVRAVSTEEWHLLKVARDGRDMTPNQIDTLARLVCRAAGRLP